MSNRFYFGDDSAPTSQTPTSYSGDDDDNYDYDYDGDTTTLPFPKPLSRPSFLTPDFEPHGFLASLSTSNRFQTLEDLQTELRELSTSINKELVDLVNENYEEFIGLGADLRGGDEKIEEVRVGLLGFEKDVKGLRERVVQRREEVQVLVDQKRELRREIGLGRGLLDLDRRLEELERRLGLKERRKSVVVAAAAAEKEDGLQRAENEVKWSDGWDNDSLGESDEEYEDEDGVPGRVKALVDDFLVFRALAKRYDHGHPFLVAQRERMHRVQDRLRLEVEATVKGTDEVAVKQKLIQMRAQMDE